MSREEKIKMEVYIELAENLIKFFPFAVPWLTMMIMLAVNDGVVMTVLTSVFAGIFVFGFLWAVSFKWLTDHFYDNTNND